MLAGQALSKAGCVGTLLPTTPMRGRVVYMLAYERAWAQLVALFCLGICSQRWHCYVCLLTWSELCTPALSSGVMELKGSGGMVCICHAVALFSLNCCDGPTSLYSRYVHGSKQCIMHAAV